MVLFLISFWNVFFRGVICHFFSSLLGLGFRLFARISLEKELDKEHQIGSIHDECRNVVFSLDVTGFSIRVGHDKTQNGHGDTDDHLRDLRDGNVHGIKPLGFHFDGHQKVIKVHDGMNGIIHDAKDNTGGCLGNVRMPAIGQDGNVMVPMQKDEGFLVNENEKGVNQFAVN